MKFTEKIEIPEEILLSLGKSGEELIDEMKKTLAVRYYQEKKLSLGQCAGLAGVSEEDFIKYLSGFNISIFSYVGGEELAADIRNA
ncbi:hypothetical protein Thexy_2156 [Thermoanaerobacterium xylanolyticum LX-11]|uniref:Uncharacterized protein n=1 Tax=Thermoanaerobacterium xylanolyticum (strain ATCC 49914 / DSM 7097 / LX-11) TaxID=858215 RepID=F6BKT1_THEXL|nr:UPF0175 family protein [Thermoanaerobacterium xylanolyticum]AEF18164.1 hypothetical protein Thexy_2156 [Thermoanaerobacterium xylanolyticum LX-11]